MSTRPLTRHEQLLVDALEQGCLMNGRSYTAAWQDEWATPPKEMFINSRGQVTLQAAMAYLSGIPFVKISVKHMRGTDVTWEHTFTKLETAPKNAREKSDLLRNMAMLHAMQLGYPHKLRSNKL